jgi:hypothetical protein
MLKSFINIVLQYLRLGARGQTTRRHPRLQARKLRSPFCLVLDWQAPLGRIHHDWLLVPVERFELVAVPGNQATTAPVDVTSSPK